MAQSHIFVTGATGYIGGAVVTRLLEHPKAASFKITALVRAKDKAEKLNSIGVDATIGSYSDLSLLEELSSQVDVVFAMADADHPDGAKAILRGLKQRYTATRKAPILIHTSGTGVLTDNAAGMHPTDNIYNDTDADQIASLPDTQVHRNVDLLIEEADKEGYVKTYIILPATIYGIAEGRLFDLGISNPHSIQIPALIKAGIQRGQGGMVGLGKNLWPNVAIDEVADLYIVLYNHILADPATPHGHEGYYFGANGEHSLYDISKTISEILVELGKGKSAEPTSFTEEEELKYFGGSYLGTNSRCRADRSFSIGWKPIKTTKDMLASIKPEIEAHLKK